jgi:hypothetical protein
VLDIKPQERGFDKRKDQDNLSMRHEWKKKLGNLELEGWSQPTIISRYGEKILKILKSQELGMA